MNESLGFEDRTAFRRWLEENWQRDQGIWIKFQKGTAQGLSYAAALEEALCFGWIDGQLKKVDADCYLRKFTPRRQGSNWSEKNKQLVADLTARGLMRPAGLAAVERAKQDGSWDHSTYFLVEDEHHAILEQYLQPYPAALDNFRQLSPSAKKQFVGFFCSAKQEETRLRRLEKVVRHLLEKKPLM